MQIELNYEQKITGNTNINQNYNYAYICLKMFKLY